MQKYLDIYTAEALEKGRGLFAFLIDYLHIYYYIVHIKSTKC